MKLCEFEKAPEKDRYKPFTTLNKCIEIKPDRKVFKTMEDCKLEKKPTKLISLYESMNLQKQQEERAKVSFSSENSWNFVWCVIFFKGEQVRVRYERLMEKLKENNDENNINLDEGSETSSLSEEECE